MEANCELLQRLDSSGKSKFVRFNLAKTLSIEMNKRIIRFDLIDRIEKSS